MSFASTAKNELARIDDKKYCCSKAELAAIIHINGSIQLSSQQNIALNISTQNAATARRIYSFLREHFEISSKVFIRKGERLRKQNAYLVTVSSRETVEKLFGQLHLAAFTLSGRHSIPEPLIKKNCCRRSYLRGAFLASGSLNAPEGTSYHLELVTSWEEHALAIQGMLVGFTLSPKVIERKGAYVVYLKDSDQIADFLTIVGAHKSVLDFENARVLKEMRNNVNRLVNCETANLNKTVEASLHQIEAIKLLQQVVGFDRLSPGLREVAENRITYPDSSLQELADLMGISKSAVNHRLRKLRELASKIEQET